MKLQELQKRLGTNVKRLRKEKGWVQEDMRDFGMNYRYFQSIEGWEANATLDTLLKLAKAFKVSVIDLLK